MTWLFASIAILAIGGLVALSLPRSTHKIQNQNQPASSHSAADPKNTSEQQQKSDGGAAVQERQNYWERFIAFVETNDKFVVAISTVIIAAFTLALFVATFFLYYGSELHSEKELRAYVGARWGDMAIQDETRAFQIRPAVQNFGRTPAYHVTFQGGVEIFDYPLPVDTKLDYAGERKSWGTIWPNQPAVGGVLGAKRILTDVELNEIKFGRKRLYAYGRLGYEDIFGKPRYTEFCFSVTWDHLGRPLGGEGAPTHSDAD